MIKEKKLTLKSLHHRINRRAYLMHRWERECELKDAEDNWILRDQYQDNMNYLKELMEELTRAKIGDEITYFILL